MESEPARDRARPLSDAPRKGWASTAPLSARGGRTGQAYRLRLESEWAGTPAVDHVHRPPLWRGKPSVGRRHLFRKQAGFTALWVRAPLSPLKDDEPAGARAPA
jgi:hypothetical protein